MTDKEFKAKFGLNCPRSYLKGVKKLYKEHKKVRDDLENGKIFEMQVHILRTGKKVFGIRELSSPLIYSTPLSNQL